MVKGDECWSLRGTSQESVLFLARWLDGFLFLFCSWRKSKLGCLVGDSVPYNNQLIDLFFISIRYMIILFCYLSEICEVVFI